MPKKTSSSFIKTWSRMPAKNKLGLFGLLIIILAIPVALYLLNRPTDNRTQASGGNCITPTYALDSISDTSLHSQLKRDSQGRLLYRLSQTDYQRALVGKDPIPQADTQTVPVDVLDTANASFIADQQFMIIPRGGCRVEVVHLGKNNDGTTLDGSYTKIGQGPEAITLNAAHPRSGAKSIPVGTQVMVTLGKSGNSQTANLIFSVEKVGSRAVIRFQPLGGTATK